MKRTYQTVLDHDPENEKIGDCTSAVLASILDMPIDEIPHFQKTYWNDSDACDRAIDKWLAARGMMLIPLPGPALLCLVHARQTQCVHIIAGYTKGQGDVIIPHAVVGMNGKIFHDPHPASPGLIGTIEDWTCFLLVNTFQER